MEASGRRGGEKPWTPPFCTVVAADTSSFSYLACSICEKPLPDANPTCTFCSLKTPNPASNRLYRLFLSVATVDEVIVVVCFDRAARVLLGCSADDFFHFCRVHPFAAEKAGEILEGEMCRMTLSKPKNGNAQHLRAVSVVPLRTGFRPIIHTLRRIYGAGNPSNIPSHS